MYDVSLSVIFYNIEPYIPKRLLLGSLVSEKLPQPKAERELRPTSDLVHREHSINNF